MNVMKINNKDYVLKYTFGSHIKMQESGLDITNFEVNGMPNFTMVRELMYYGLEKFHKVSREECEELIDSYLEEGHSLEELLNTVIQAYMKSFGLKEVPKVTNEEVGKMSKKK